MELFKREILEKISKIETEIKDLKATIVSSEPASTYQVPNVVDTSELTKRRQTSEYVTQFMTKTFGHLVAKDPALYHRFRLFTQTDSILNLSLKEAKAFNRLRKELRRLDRKA